VVRELRHPGAPASVSDWARKLPAWVEERVPIRPLALALGAGETEAIALAGEFSQSGVDTEILTDDREASMVAQGRGLQTSGTVAVLILADQARLLDLEAAIKRLQSTNFYITDQVAEEALAQSRKRRGT
jgi:predicted nucleic acid-binding protein